MAQQSLYNKKLILDTIDNWSYQIFSNGFFMLAMAVFGSWAFSADEPTILLKVMLSVIIFEIVLTKDVTVIIAPIILATMGVLLQYGQFITDYLHLVPYGICVGLAMLFHSIFYRTTFKCGKSIYPILAVALAVAIGGVNVGGIPSIENFAQIYYYIGLSIFVVLFYLLFINYVHSSDRYNCSKVLCNAFLAVAVMGILMIFPVAIAKLAEGKLTWYVQWSNNLSTFFILAMPFTFYCATRKRYGFIYFILGTLELLGTVFTQSRGGILFGTITFVLCIVATMIFASKANRILYAIFIAIGVACAMTIVFLNEEILAIIKDIMKVESGEARVNMFKLAVQNFINNPVFGMGIGYVGDYYAPAPGAMYWYHSTLFQIIGSFGIVGIIAYGYQYIHRTITLLNKKSLFNVFMFIAFVGFELMAFVNPGDFVPVPNMIILVLFLAVAEVTKHDKIQNIDALKYDEKLAKSQQVPIKSMVLIAVKYCQNAVATLHSKFTKKSNH